ncbi:MAG: putative manganese-dependent inorganic diphosphatase [Desulfuromonas sp.]|nr:putative manganese-dependent inorganic diphosphatase [Desulfuromonas sp.]
MVQPKIYVIGHMNPDTDSVCSAIAYARLRKQQGLLGVQPARAGTINRQTEFILDELAVAQPQLLMDVTPRLRDIVDGQDLVTINESAPLSRALELFHLHNVRIIPVVDDDLKPQGMLYLKRLSERFLVPSQERELRRVLASPRSICQCLKANALHEFDADKLEDLNLYVAAMAEATFLEKLADQDARKMVLIAGDREEILRAAVSLGVRVLVVVAGLEISPEVLQLGKENNVTILSTMFDTATSAWLTRLATPVVSVAEKNYITLSGKDRIDELRISLMHSDVPGVMIVNGSGQVEAVATKSHLLIPSTTKLILVDHNELTQAVPGADKVEIIEIVDHHRLGSFQTEKPICFINQPLGSTCTLVATLYRNAGIVPDAVTAGLMLSGLLSDTVVLKSPTTTDVDREIAEWLGELSGFDPQEYGRRIFASSSSISAYDSLEKVITTDFKVFTSGSCQFGIGQVEVVNFHEFHSLKDALSSELDKIKAQRDLSMVGLLVTDIVAGNSELLISDDKQLSYVLGYPQLDNNLFELRGVLSRKKQLIPHLSRVLSAS